METRVPKELIKDLEISSGETNILVYEGVINTDENAITIDKLADEPTYIEVYLDGLKLLLSEYKYKDSVIKLNTPVQKDTNYNITIFQKANIMIKANTNNDSYFETQGFEEIESGEIKESGEESGLESGEESGEIEVIGDGSPHIVFTAAADCTDKTIFNNSVYNNFNVTPVDDYNVYINGELTEQKINSMTFTQGDQVRIVAKAGVTCYPTIYLYNNSTRRTTDVIESIDAPLPYMINGSSRGKANFDNSFSDATNLKSIPDEMFKYNSESSSFKSCFTKTSITTISQKLFKYNTKATSFANLFFNCKITSIPQDFFRYNTEVTSFSSVFQGNNITSIPHDLFMYNTKATNFYTAFYNTKITSIPNDLFMYNTKATNFNSTFSDTMITSIPHDLFMYNTVANDFTSVFEQCTNLTSIPNDLFDYTTVLASNLKFASSFRNCSNITGDLPALWDKYSTASHNLCFAGCSKASNYGTALNQKWADY